MKKLVLAICACYLSITISYANVRMPLIFGDHMVLQQKKALTIWGWADPGEKVSVSFAGQKGEATASSDGTWKVNLKPLKNEKKGQSLIVKGNNTLTFQDVLVGDVWVASGQSNMEWGIKNNAYANDVANSEDPLLRLFFVPKNTSLNRLYDIEIPEDVQNPEWAAKWVLCTPEALSKINGQGFSSAAYYFARDIRKANGQALGIIESAWGGTRAEAWTSLSGLKNKPTFENYISLYEKNVKDNPEIILGYKDKKAVWDIAMKEWNEKKQADPSLPRPVEPIRPNGGNNGPSNLFNAMISPLIPFPIKGAIWYQGESNGSAAEEYATLFPRMITDWREKWGVGDFSFVFVQLPNFGRTDTVPNPKGSSWRLLREAQLKTLSLPNTAMAITIDIGEPSNIHPIDKYDVGHRLALAARKSAYGENIVGSGPLYKSMTIKDNKIILSFAHVGSGLKIGVSPLATQGEQALAPSTKLTGFAIAGADHEFVWADAVIEGDKVIVSGSKVANPVAVRYAYSANPICNLYNKENLPASPFRTDDWEQ